MKYGLKTGNHDAPVVAEYILERFCPRWTPAQRRKLIWINSHASLDDLAADHPLMVAFPGRVNVKNAKVAEYNAGMQVELARICNISRVVDVFSMTHGAVRARLSKISMSLMRGVE